MGNLEGRTEQIQVHHNQVKEITNSQGRVVMEVMRYVDNVYHIFLRNENTLVLFNGERVEISAPQMLKSRACGLCGDLDHENTADLQTPERCIMSKPRYSAYSYMIEESCQGIPSQDKPRYEQERQQCAKTRIIPTPTNTISKILPHKTLSQVFHGHQVHEAHDPPTHRQVRKRQDLLLRPKDGRLLQDQQERSPRTQARQGPTQARPIRLRPISFHRGPSS